MKDTRIFLLVILSAHLICCAGIKNGQSTIQEGISGRVMWLSGNVMPSPDKPAVHKPVPVSRVVCIYEQTPLTAAEGEAPLFKKINRKLIARVKADKKGYFQCTLPAGRYSVFTVEPDGRLFANLFDGDGHIHVVEVKSGAVASIEIQINYNAFY